MNRPSRRCSRQIETLGHICPPAHGVNLILSLSWAMGRSPLGSGIEVREFQIGKSDELQDISTRYVHLPWTPTLLPENTGQMMLTEAARRLKILSARI